MKSLKLILVSMFLIFGLVSCGGGGGGGSSASTPGGNQPGKILSLSLENSGLVPVVNSQATKFYVYVTNTGNATINQITWSLSNSSGFKIIDTSGAARIAVGQTGKVLIEAEDSKGVNANSAVLVANVDEIEVAQGAKLDAVKSYSIPITSYNLDTTGLATSDNQLALLNLGVFNTSSGHTSYSLYLINQGTQVITFNSNTLLNQLPSNLSYELGVCPNPLPTGAVCQINLTINQPATTNNEGSITHINLVPNGKIFTTDEELVPQIGGVLTLDSRILANIVLLPVNDITVDDSSGTIESGVGYITNTGIKPATITNIVATNGAINVINQCGQLNPGALCQYFVTANPGQITSSGNTLITVKYNDSKSNGELNTIANWNYIKPIDALNPKLVFYQPKSITLESGSESAIITLTNVGNVDLTNITLPKVSLNGARGQFSIVQVGTCPNPLPSKSSCEYRINYTAKASVAEVLSGSVGGISANYKDGSGQTKSYNMDGALALNLVFNSSQALLLSSSVVNKQSKWSQNPSQSSDVTIKNTSSDTLTNISTTSLDGWISATGCPSSLAPGDSCVLSITTHGTLPQQTDTSASGILTINYTIGSIIANQAIGVSYLISAKPVVTPGISVSPIGAIQLGLGFNSQKSVNLKFTNISSATNGGNTDINLNINSLLPKAIDATLSFNLVLESSSSCINNGGVITLHSGDSCIYQVVSQSFSNSGLFRALSQLQYNYASYSDNSESPQFNTSATYLQEFNINISPNTAQLQIVNMGTNNFANMTLESQYSNTYSITNIGSAAVSGNISFSSGNLPATISINGLSNCSNLRVNQSCNITLVYAPQSIISGKSLDSASLSFNDGSSIDSEYFIADVINAVSPGAPNIVVSSSLNGCGQGNGESYGSICYLNTGAQASNFSLVFTFTNIGPSTANKFFLQPQNFSSAWTLTNNTCGTSENQSITLAKNGGQCSITYVITNSDSEGFDYDLSTKKKIGVVGYDFIGGAPTQTLIYPSSNIYIQVNDAALSIWLPGPARLESSVPVSLILSNWYKSGSVSANLAVNSSTSLPTAGFTFESVITWNVEAGNYGAIYKTNLTSNYPVIVVNNDYSLSLSSNWTDSTSTIHSQAFNVKAPFFKTILAGAGNYSCGISVQDNAYCFGSNDSGQLGVGNQASLKLVPTLVSNGLKFKQLTVGDSHTCGITYDGTTYCWGFNNSGQLGNSQVVNQFTPVKVINSDSLKFINLAAGSYHTCAITANGQAYCWGLNSNGQLGNNNVIGYSSIPVPVLGSYQFKSITAGDLHSCGIANDGNSYCWGNNQYGQLGIGDGREVSIVPMPTVVENSDTLNFVRLKAGGGYSCAITINNTSYCWGRNNVGQLGNNTKNNVGTPTKLSGNYVLNDIATSLELNAAHTCVVANDGSVYCFGDNRNGQLGDGSLSDKSVPTKLKSSVNFISVVTGSYHTCGLDINGGLYCWGYNQDGQLGNGNTVNSLIPDIVN